MDEKIGFRKPASWWVKKIEKYMSGDVKCFWGEPVWKLRECSAENCVEILKRQALCFWGLVQGEMRGSCGEKIMREILSAYVKNQNSFLSLVAMAESLPCSIWRKILWRHNINFESAEAFLRRIEPEQIQAIKDNYADLFVAKTRPRILNWFEKRRSAFSVENLLSEEGDFRLRYKSKGSWIFELLNLNFDFSAYPDSENDKKSAAKTWKNFLSVKNNTAGDFVVNDEDGRYWALYKSARSNYAWFPNRNVRLKSHICPGFWWTFIVHLVFWLISPLSAAAFLCVSLPAEVSLFGLICIALWMTLSAITPFWCFLAFLKFAFTRVLLYLSGKTAKAVWKKIPPKAQAWLEWFWGKITDIFDTEFFFGMGCRAYCLCRHDCLCCFRCGLFVFFFFSDG